MLVRVLGLLMCICVQYKQQRQQNCATDAGKAHDERIYAASQLRDRAFCPFFARLLHSQEETKVLKKTLMLFGRLLAIYRLLILAA